MKKRHYFWICIPLMMLMISCVSSLESSLYIEDETSLATQKKMKQARVGYNSARVGIGMLNALLANEEDEEDCENEEEEASEMPKLFRTFGLVNRGRDTLQVDMYTDYVYDELNTCNILGITLPPNVRLNVLTPFDADYQILSYPRGKGEAPREQWINTADRKKVVF